MAYGILLLLTVTLTRRKLTFGVLIAHGRTRGVQSGFSHRKTSFLYPGSHHALLCQDDTQDTSEQLRVCFKPVIDAFEGLRFTFLLCSWNSEPLSVLLRRCEIN